MVGVVESVLKEKLRRRQIGAAWPLFFLICRHADHKGFYTTTYRELSQALSTKISTLKYWRRSLTQHGVVASYSGGHCVHFCLQTPFSDLISLNASSMNTLDSITFHQAMGRFPMELQKKIVEWISENPSLLVTS